MELANSRFLLPLANREEEILCSNWILAYGGEVEIAHVAQKGYAREETFSLLPRIQRLFWLYRLIVFFRGSKPFIMAQLTPIDPNSIACDWASGLATQCIAANPGLTRIPDFLASAACLCYQDGWAPDIWDNYYRSCLSYSMVVSSVSNTQLTTNDSVMPTTAPCRDLGNFRSANATRTDSTLTGAPVTEPGFLSCLALSVMNAECQSSTAGFTSLSASRRASCLCYSTQAWKPSVYDGFASPCYMYLSTARPEIFSTVTATAPLTTNPCARFSHLQKGSRTVVIMRLPHYQLI